jgi:signal transduction histidine kinase
MSARLQLSVRTRLTTTVALLSVGLAVTLALIAPRIVERVLVEDIVTADAQESASSLTDSAGVPSLGEPSGFADAFGALEDFGGLEVFGDLFAGAVQAALDDLGPNALAELRQRSADGVIVVALSPDLAIYLDGDGAVESPPFDLDSVDVPIVTVTELFELSTELQGGAGFFADVFGGMFGEMGIADATPPDFAVPTLDATELAWATSTIDGVEYIVGAPREGVTRSVDRLGTWLWWSVPLAALVAGLVTWLLAGRALRPVRAITERAATIRGGTLHDRVPVPATGDEIAALATTMNDMLARLESDDNRRRRFVSDASHELRSPVSVLRTAADVAADHPETTTLTELAGTVGREADRMATMIGDLLSLARHDEGLPPPGVEVDLDDIVLAEAARARSVPIDTRDVSAGRARGRADELARMTAHLLDNAARHARTTVKVGLRTDGNDVVLTVDDDGPGVPADQRAAVFERFVRLDEARSRDRGGAGLGLAVVAATTQSMGGSVSVTESDLGGARFIVTLPSR